MHFVYITLNTPTINRTHGGIRTIAGLKKHIHYMRIQLKEKVQKMAALSNLRGGNRSDSDCSGSGGGENQDSKDSDDDEIKMTKRQTLEIGEEIINATPSLGVMV